jgi:protein CpxP
MEKNSKVWKWTTVIMLLCNMGLLTMILLRPCAPPPPPMHGGPHGGPHHLDKFIIEELDLNVDQQVKFEKLKKEHRSKIEALQKEGRKLRNSYFADLKKDGGNDSLVMEKAKAIGLNQQEIELVTYNHFQALRDILTDAQKETFDSIIMEVLHRMAPPPPAPPPPAAGAPPAPPMPPSE